MSRTTTVPEAREPELSRDSISYRPDIDGLRAVAVVVVVLYHARVPGFSGGYVGVDVFFVISGWLITQQLLARSLVERRVALIDFWARRIRRLIPAAFCMVVGTTILSWLLLSPLDWRLIAQRGFASTLYVSNLLFARSAGDYFAGPLKDSPYLHTWSLALEEQFYLVWPLLIAAVVLVTRHRAEPLYRRGLMLTMGGVLVVSMLINLRQTAADSPWAFFGLPARAWEFAAAGLVATWLFGRRAVIARFAGAAAGVGVALIVAATVLLDDATPYPGWAATIPVVGTLLVLVAGHDNMRSGAVERVLRTRPFVTIGLLSYSFYLWHWPLMVIAVGWTYRDTVAIRLVAAAVSLLIAAASYRWIENPIRRSVTLRRSPARTYALGAVLTIGALIVGGALFLHQRRAITQEPYRGYEAARQSFKHTCDAVTSEGGHTYCEAGSRSSSTTVMLVGDSHAAQWMHAFDEVARELDVRLVLRSSGNCPSTPVLPGDEEPSCAAFQRDTAALVEELGPTAVVLADGNVTKSNGFPDGARDWREAVRAQARSLEGAGARVGLVVDAPLSDDPLLCLARGRSEAHCTVGIDDALSEVRTYQPATADLVEDGDVVAMDVNDAICDRSACAIRHDDTWVFAAFEHITRDFTLTQTPAIRSFLQELVGQPTA